MAWSTPDLTNITEVVKGLIQYEIDHTNPPPGNISLSCNSPDTARGSDGHCHLTLYLLHVGRDPYWRNAPVNGPRPQPNSNQPLSLNLSYLLTAWCDKDFATEQRAMSIALHAIHSHPIVNKALIQHEVLTQWLADGEFTLSIEADTIEEMSRLWQAITVPIRLSALIRVGIVFIAPSVDVPPPMPAPTAANLSVGPMPTGTATVPLLFAGGGLTMQPALPGSDSATVTATTGPLTVAGGGSVTVSGNGLTLPAAAGLFLGAPGTATEWDASSWLQGAAQPGQLSLVLPKAYADPATALPAPPTATPLPGLYTLAVGSNAPHARSNAIPLSIAPRVDGMLYPAQLEPVDATGLFAIAGAGFVPASTILALGALPLTHTGAPSPGNFTVSADGKAIQFRLPDPAPPPGNYPVLVQVNGVAAEPAWVVVVSP
jgi:hypothetical protein